MQNTYKALTNPKWASNSQRLRFWVLGQFCDLQAKEPWCCVGIWSSRVNDGTWGRVTQPSFAPKSVKMRIYRALDWSRKWGQEREEQGTGESWSVLKSHYGIKPPSSQEVQHSKKSISLHSRSEKSLPLDCLCLSECTMEQISSTRASGKVESCLGLTPITMICVCKIFLNIFLNVKNIFPQTSEKAQEKSPKRHL